MGVPGFYRWVTQRYPLIRHRMNDPSRPKIDYFYIDFNCIIYNALRSISLSSGGTLEQLFNEVCRYLDLLVQTVKPQVLIFIAVDGPAPFAKCTQQRSRRFVAAKNSNPGSFNTTSISVGTKFMEDLHEKLSEFLHMKVVTDKNWSTPEVIYSSHRTPGEGEHKFFNYLRQRVKQSDYNKSSTHCVYSPDADLVFLCLQTKEKYFYVMREWDGWMGGNDHTGNASLQKLKTSSIDFELLHIPLLREYLTFDFPGVPIDNLVDDFAGFSFLIGNDFIPHFPDVIIQKGDFEFVVQAYQEVVEKMHQYLIKDGAFNKPVLREFLKIVVNKLGNKESIKSKNKPQKQAKPSKINIQRDLLSEARTYLKQKYPKETEENKEFEKELAFAILDSFDWVLQYYTKGCPSWVWCFTYFYAPPLSIVAEYVDQHESHFELDRPPSPFEQLLNILPPQSKDLLPPKLASLMVPPSEIASYYPTDFKVDLNDRAVEHEAVILIPFVDVFKVRKLVDAIIPQLSPEEQKRNQMIPSYSVRKEGLVEFNIDEKLRTIQNSLAYSLKPGQLPPALPSFFNPPVPLSISREVANVQIFKFPSTSDSLIISIDTQRYNTSLPYDINSFVPILGKVVLVNYPFLRPALVIQVLNDSSALEISEDGEIESMKANAKSIIMNLAITYKKEKGIDISKSNIVFGVRELILTNSIETRIMFSNKITYVPYEFTFPTNISNTFDRIPRHIDPLLQVNDTVVVASGPNAGKVGVVKEIRANNTKALVHLKKRILPDGFKECFETDKNEWTAFGSICNKYRVDNSVLAKCFSSLKVENHRDLDIALTLFYEHNVLEGFTRKGKNGFEFSKVAVQTIDAYFQKVPDLLNFFRDFDESHELQDVSLDEIYRSGNEKAKIKQVTDFINWIKGEAPTSKAYLVESDYLTLPQSSLNAAENKLRLGSITDEDLEDVEEPISNLIWSGIQKPKLQIAKLGSRVVSIAECGSIPFGTQGTIAGIDKNTREAFVLSDKEEEYATNMRKRLLSIRGFVQNIDDLFITDFQ